MHVMFDLLGTVIGAMDYSLRPGIRETIGVLRKRGCIIGFWTSGRTDDYSAILRNLGIEGEVHKKGTALPFVPDLCVDDEPEEWMPGRVVRVDTHAADMMPGGAIDVSELLEGILKD